MYVRLFAKPTSMGCKEHKFMWNLQTLKSQLQLDVWMQVVNSACLGATTNADI